MIQYNMLTYIWYNHLALLWYSRLFSLQYNPICYLALPCSYLSTPILETSNFAQNNLPLGYTSPSSSMYCKLEVINNRNIYCCHYYNAPLVAFFKCWSYLEARKIRKSRNSRFLNLKDLQNLGHFCWLEIVFKKL